MNSPQARHGRAVLVGLSGSRNSIVALRRAVTQARWRMAVLEVVHVVRPASSAGEAAAASDWLNRTVRAAFPDGLRVTARRRIERGDPAPVLVRLSKDAELLVIGSQTNPRHEHVLGGPTVSHCLDFAHCPVDVCADHRAHAADHTADHAA
jgi:nucleotide-binding universal stress UspA family protein